MFEIENQVLYWDSFHQKKKKKKEKKKKESIILRFLIVSCDTKSNDYKLEFQMLCRTITLFYLKFCVIFYETKLFTL